MKTQETEPRKYIMGGFVLPITIEHETSGSSGKVRVIDAKGELIRTFHSTQFAQDYADKLNANPINTDIHGFRLTEAEKERWRK